MVFNWFKRKKRQVPGTQQPLEIDGDEPYYFIRSCLTDGASCEACSYLDGFAWVPEAQAPSGLPVLDCTSHEGCRCDNVAVFAMGGNEVETAEFIRSRGGVVSRQALRRLDDQRQDEVNRNADQRDAASKKSSEARDLEKSNPAGSIGLYRECIELAVAYADQSGDALAWRDVPHYYNRLTLLLERQGNLEDAVSLIREFETRPCQSAGSKVERSALEKRLVRLEKQIRASA